MKEYDRESRSWVDEETMHKKLGKRKLCKGGKDHDWILCLPPYIGVKDSALGLEKVQAYYAIEDAREDSEVAFDEKLEAIGIKTRIFRSGRFFGRRRYHICTVCLKRK